jgi:hypothetical protein
MDISKLSGRAMRQRSGLCLQKAVPQKSPTLCWRIEKARKFAVELCGIAVSSFAQFAGVV